MQSKDAKKKLLSYSKINMHYHYIKRKMIRKRKRVRMLKRSRIIRVLRIKLSFRLNHLKELGIIILIKWPFEEKLSILLSLSSRNTEV